MHHLSRTVLESGKTDILSHGKIGALDKKGWNHCTT